VQRQLPNWKHPYDATCYSKQTDLACPKYTAIRIGWVTAIVLSSFEKRQLEHGHPVEIDHLPKKNGAIFSDTGDYIHSFFPSLLPINSLNMW
jgi:hypothetical protein